MIGRQFVLTGSVAEAHEVTDGGRIYLPPIQLPDRLPPRHEFRILTEIATFGDIVLGDYDCGLTLPQSVVDKPTLTPGGFYEVWYETHGIPGLRLRQADRKPVDSFPPFGQSRESMAAKSTETMTESISHKNFSGHLNALFRVDMAETSLELELVEVEVGKPIDPSLREPFTLIFQGPKDSILPEGAYNVSNDGAGSFELYIIPIVSPVALQSYQVIFN
jgi:hypothetical protein